MKKLLLAASLLLSAIPNTNASIYVDLDKETVTRINDGIEKIFVTRSEHTYSFANAKAGTPSGTEGLDQGKKLIARMNDEEYSNYSLKWFELLNDGIKEINDNSKKLLEAEWAARNPELAARKKEEEARRAEEAARKAAKRREEAARRAAREAEEAARRAVREAEEAARRAAIEKDKATVRAQGWSEELRGIWFKHHGRDCSWHQCTYKALVWCRSRSCGDINARISITNEGVSLGTATDTGYGRKGQKILLTFGPLNKGTPSLIQFGFGRY